MPDSSAWVTGLCAELGLVVTAPGELVQRRPWSLAVVYRVREAAGTDGRVWFKANGIGTRHEPALLTALGSLVPDLVPEVLAIDARRGWSLTRDAGPTWRSAMPVADHWPLWEDLLQRYATAQLTLAAHRTRLLATGTPERSPATLPNRAADLVAELTLLDEDSGGLSVPASQALTARLPAYGHWCRELEESGIPSTIQHDDLHSNNICRPVLPADPGDSRPGGGQPGVDNRLAAQSAGTRIIDWGDASFGHPFGTMTTTLRSVAYYGGCEVDDPPVQRLRDAYLEPFTTYAPRSELISLVDVARRVGAGTRALSWQAALVDSPTAVQRELDFPVREWLLELLVPSP